jgi:hypothetical protein
MGPGPLVGGGGITMMPVQDGPKCHACGGVIVGEIVTAGNRRFHPEHFVCEYCSQPFPGGRFITGPDENFYCETDYHELFGKRCHVCKDVIRGKSVDGNGTFFHPQHFCCYRCGSDMNGKKFKLHPETKNCYCMPCYDIEKIENEPEEHMCSRCKRPIIGPYITLHGQFLHPEHYRCTECGCELGGGNCFEFDNCLYCKPHYEALLRKSCAKCNKPIMGRSITALGQVWHPEHFCCHICNDPLLDNEFFEEDGKAYCKEHYIQLFGKFCGTCNQPITKEGVKFLEKDYHQDCFLCTKCQAHLKSGSFIEWDSQPLCMTCYGRLPKKLRKQVEKRKQLENKARRDKEKEEKKKLKDT